GPPNVLPAAKDWGGSRLALAAARMHPTEWLAGEVAGHLAAFCLRRGVEPAAVRITPNLLAAFQQELRDAGIPLRWSEIIPDSGRQASGPGVTSPASTASGSMSRASSSGW